jgi:hypothetical protein
MSPDFDDTVGFLDSRGPVLIAQASWHQIKI